MSGLNEGGRTADPPFKIIHQDSWKPIFRDSPSAVKYIAAIILLARFFVYPLEK